MAENYGYSLEQGQVLRRIGPPFPELLKNVSAQTGLTFKKDYCAIKRIVIEPIE
jgi:hypothetical protein